jgi:hypothetical protein
MALNGKYISTKEIIANVLRDNLYKTQDIEVSALIEWVSECLDLIGVPYAYKDTIDIVKIENQRGMLPCDLHTLIQASGVTKEGIQFPLRETTGTFHPLFLINSNNLTPINLLEPISYDDDGNPTFNFLINEATTLNKNTVNQLPTIYRDATYKLNDNFIFTNFTEGYVLLSYTAYPVDKEGFPLVPDNIKFKQAVQAYLRFKLDYRLWRTNEIGRDVFEYSEREYMWYVGAATTAGLMPSLDKMEAWKNMTLKLTPQYSQHDKFFEELGTQEHLSRGQRLRRY